jgi:TRAP-type transport system periplasmic protein
MRYWRDISMMRSRMMSVWAVCIGALLFGVLLSDCGKSDTKSVVVRTSLILGETSDWYRGLVRWKELTEARSENRITIRIFPRASLASGKQDTELEMVQTGGIDVSLESSILLSGIDPAFAAWSLPWLFKDYGDADTVLASDVGREMLQGLEQKNLVGLAYGHNGLRQITNSLRPISAPQDLHGMKIRVPAIPMYLDIFRALGADATVMNFGEVFVGLQQGTIDGQENPLSVIRSARLHEVQDHLTIWNYSYDPVVLCANMDFWMGLSAADRDLLRNTAEDAFEFQRGLVENGEESILQEFEKSGTRIIRLSEEQIALFREAVKGVYENYGGDIEMMRTRD